MYSQLSYYLYARARVYVIIRCGVGCAMRVSLYVLISGVVVSVTQ